MEWFEDHQINIAVGGGAVMMVLVRKELPMDYKCIYRCIGNIVVETLFTTNAFPCLLV